MLEAQSIIPRRIPFVRQLPRRRGAVYLVVLGAALIVSALAFGSILVTRANRRVSADVSDAAAARQNAESAAELARLWIRQDPNWRTNRPNGVWVSNQPIAGGTFSVEVTDPLDGSLPNRPHDTVSLKVTGVQGNSRHVMQMNLVAQPVPLPALNYAIHTAGEIHVSPLVRLDALGWVISTNGSLNNEATIDGSISVATVSQLGTVTGSQTIGAPAKALPPTDVAEKYAALGTLISAAEIDKQVLSPAYNPWGTPNPDGVYVVRPIGDFLIRRSRIHGTLVVICPAGNKVVIDDRVFLHPFRSDYPTLIVTGDLHLVYKTMQQNLGEPELGTNFNPPGAPYNGSSDTDKLDTYPNEIQGLVHALGKVTMRQRARVRGILIGQSSGSDAIKIEERAEVVYTSSVFLNPPQWFTTDVPMVPGSGSWKQVAN